MRCRSTIRASFLLAFAACLFFFAAPRGHAQFFGGVSATTIPQAGLIQPADLNNLIKGPAAARPLMLQVGSRMMFAQAHIPGSFYIGPGSQPSGLQALESKVESSPKSRFIVLYCGCCPWTHCPNVGPAYKKLHDLGYTNVKVLYIASNFGDDWVSKGYPVQSGQ